MRIAFVSDVHLERGYSDIKNTNKANILILAGDILVLNTLFNSSAKTYSKFLTKCSEEFPQVYILLGNHEFYGSTFSPRVLITAYNEYLSEVGLHNIRAIENETVKLTEEYNLFGSTLWSDFNNGCPISMLKIPDAIQDFSCIYDTYGTYNVSPSVILAYHKDCIKELEASISKEPEKKWIIVTHHAPSFMSVSEYYRDPRFFYLNGAFASELGYLMCRYPQITNWVHGHMHQPVDYNINETRVISNPYGYKGLEHDKDEVSTRYFDIQ